MLFTANKMSKLGEQFNIFYKGAVQVPRIPALMGHCAEGGQSLSET